MDKWTIETVKRDLPVVRVKFMGRLYYGRVTGRLCQFANVSPYQEINNKKLVTTIMGPIYHFTWDSIVDALNHNKTLDLS